MEYQYNRSSYMNRSDYNRSMMGDDCEQYGPEYTVVMVLQVVCCAVGSVLNTLVLIAAIQANVMQLNLRILLAHLYGNLLCFTLFSAVRALRMLIEGFCRDPIDVRHCYMEEMNVLVPISNVFYSLFAVCLDRIYAACRTKKEERRASLLVTAFLIAVVWTCSLTFHFTHASLLDTDDVIRFCDATLALEHSRDDLSRNLLPVTSQALCMAIEGLFVVVLLIIRFYYRCVIRDLLNRAKYSLTLRFLIVQNYEAIVMIIPSVVLHAVCFMPSFAMIILAEQRRLLGYRNKMFVIQVICLWKLLFSVFNPLLAFWVNAHMNKQLRRLLSFICFLHWSFQKPVKVAVLDANNHQIHFDFIEKQWNTRFRHTVPKSVLVSSAVKSDQSAFKSGRTIAFQQNETRMATNTSN